MCVQGLTDNVNKIDGKRPGGGKEVSHVQRQEKRGNSKCKGPALGMFNGFEEHPEGQDGQRAVNN